MQKVFNGYEILTFFYRTLANCSTVFVKVAVEIVKRAQHYVLFWFTCFHKFFKVVQVYLYLASHRVIFLQNEWLIKTFWKHPKRSKFVCIKSNLQFMYNLHKCTLFVKNEFQDTLYLEIPLLDFCVQLCTTEDKHLKYNYVV